MFFDINTLNLKIKRSNLKASYWKGPVDGFQSAKAISNENIELEKGMSVGLKTDFLLF